jgi:hypothetical protein
MLFEKIFKYFAVMATVCTPMNIIQDFLIDSGADRNLISQKDLPDQCSGADRNLISQKDLPDQWIQYLPQGAESETALKPSIAWGVIWGWSILRFEGLSTSHFIGSASQ